MERIPVNIPDVHEDDIDAVVAVMRAGWISGDAPMVAEFEQKFADLHGKKFGVAVPNGTLAIDLSVSALGISPGDEVIMPSFAIISCVSQVLRLGAKPVFVDADPVTWNMNVETVEDAITNKTRAIMVVHTYGLPVDMDPVMELASRYSIPVIEDAAESHGLMYKDTVCGSMGFISTFSFYANKNITTGEGGMILTDDQALASRLRFFRNLTFNPEQRFVHEELGWNLRFTGIQAAMGLSQLSRLSAAIEKRRRFASVYRDVLQGIEGLEMAPAKTSFGANDYWVVGAVLDGARWGRAAEVAVKLDLVGIQTRPFFFPLHQQPVYKKSDVFQSVSLPVAENLGRQGLYFPNGLGMSDGQIHRAAERIREVLAA